jgi:hypothetical protein
MCNPFDVLHGASWVYTKYPLCTSHIILKDLRVHKRSPPLNDTPKWDYQFQEVNAKELILQGIELQDQVDHRGSVK